MTESEAYLALNLIPGLGPVKAGRMVQQCGSAWGVLQASADALTRVRGVSRPLAETVASWDQRVDVQREGQLIKDAGVHWVSRADAEFPEGLRNMYDGPLGLYVRGSLDPADRRAVALVGSRNMSRYGGEMARRLAFELARAGLTVVSGLARGIDTQAHLGAVAAKGRTLAVLGCGIDQVYPAENQALAERVAEQGAVLSEFPIGTKPDRQTFPIRNRIVSGLSMGTVVVEAMRASGAMITARQALDQGRQVFAVPGRADTPHATGCHQLIKEGAKLVEGADDICAEFEFLSPIQAQLKLEPAGEGDARGAAARLSHEERILVETLSVEEWHLDDLIDKCELPAALVSTTLLRLELRKLVLALPGKRFVRVR